MKDNTWEPGDTDAAEWWTRYKAWKDAYDKAVREQQTALLQVAANQAWAATLAEWIKRLADARAAAQSRADELAGNLTSIGGIDDALGKFDPWLAEHRLARETATAELLNGPPSTEPLVLLPLRLETAWRPDGRQVTIRIYPSQLHVDSHDKRLSETETVAASQYWATRNQVPAGSDATLAASVGRQAWNDLVRQVGAQRAAWLVTSTDPAIAARADHGKRDSSLDQEVTVRLLPTLFAVVLYRSDGPVNIAPQGEPDRYVIWIEPTNPADRDRDTLPMDPWHRGEPETAWTTDLSAAKAAGLAATLDIQDGIGIERLLVVGVRKGKDDLPGLISSHSFTHGVELLADGTATNNSQQVRAAHSPARDADVAELLIRTDAPPIADGSAGAQLADLLGFDRARLSRIAGATNPRAAVHDAIHLLVGTTVRSPLIDRLASDPARAWDLVHPAGPAPTLRIGQDPYAILPSSAPARWTAAHTSVTDEVLAQFQDEWARIHRAPIDVDPAVPEATPPTPRHITHNDDTQLTALLLESATSLAWTSDGAAVFAGIEGFVGPTTGPQSPHEYLTALHDATTQAELDAIALPPALLAQVAYTAKKMALGDATDVNRALSVLADRAVEATGRPDLARTLAAHLDARSYRVDAWRSAAYTDRARRQRSSAALTVGAFGYLTDLAPRAEPRSDGHIHAPSLPHAATAAVLRAGYLGRRRADRAARAATPADNRAAESTTAGTAPALAIDLSSARVRQARWILSAVRAGQPLAAVLGYQFERDLTDRGLQRYLGAFRKLTRFHTGTKLETLEQVRGAAAGELATARANLVAADGAASAASDVASQLDTALDDARQHTLDMFDAATNDTGLQKLRDDLNAATVSITSIRGEIDGAGNRPEPAQHIRTINRPDADDSE